MHRPHPPAVLTLSLWLGSIELRSSCFFGVCIPLSVLGEAKNRIWGSSVESLLLFTVLVFVFRVFSRALRPPHSCGWGNPPAPREVNVLYL